MRFILLAFTALVAISSASPAVPSSSRHVVHEKRNSVPAKWSKRSRMDPTAKLPIRVGLKQRNLQRAHEYLDSVSNPSSKDYGKHWSIDDVTKTFAPSQESRERALQWLSQNQISSVKNTGALHTLEFELSVAEAEKLLQTEYFVYEHDDSGHVHVACEQYSVPEHIADHISIITPTLHFDVKPHHHISKRAVPNPADPATSYHPYHKGYQNSKPMAGGVNGTNTTSLQHCLDWIDPDCLRSLYNIPVATQTPCADNSFSIVEYQENTYIPEDLDAFFGNFSPSAVGARPELVIVNGGKLDFSDPSSFDFHGEADLDLQFAMALTYPQNVTLYQASDFTKTVDDATFIQTKVVSTSWGFNEKDLTPKYKESLCNEYMKLGLQGVSILFSTGDNGVAGSFDSCDNRFQPDFPASCPFVTAVGATQLDDNATDIAGTLASNGQPEVAINSDIKSGGGFSDMFTIPDYQKDVVQSYLKNTPPPYDADIFNNTGNARAIPDISANGHNYTVMVGGVRQAVDGTSASTPLLASMITMINEARLSAGKSTVGFLNPVLYAYADKYIRDVTQGNNPGCGTDGFEAAEGWDPVTGLGTPDYAKLLEVFMSLD